MDLLPTEVFLQVVNFLNPAELRRFRLVSYRCNSVASDIFLKTHEVKIATMRELRCLVYLNLSQTRLSLLSNINLHLSLFDLDSIVLFASEYGPYIRSYILNLDSASTNCGSKIFALLSNSPNIVNLVVNDGLRVQVPEEVTEFQLFTKLEKITWKSAISSEAFVIKILRNAPSLVLFSSDAVLKLCQEVNSSTDLSDLLPHLSPKVRIDTKIELHLGHNGQESNIYRISASRNRIHQLVVQGWRTWGWRTWGWPDVIGSGWEEDAVTKLVSSQAESLRTLDVNVCLIANQIPLLPNLVKLKLYFGDVSSILFPAKFPRLTHLEFGGIEFFIQTTLPAWPSVRVLRVLLKKSDTGQLLSMNIREVFTNLYRAELRLDKPSGWTLGYFLLNLCHVVELRLTFQGKMKDDFWEEFTGGAEQISKQKLLSDQFSPPPETFPHSIGNFANLKRLWLSYYETDKVKGITFATRLGNFRLEILTLKHFARTQEGHRSRIGPYLEILNKFHDNILIHGTDSPNTDSPARFMDL